MGDSDGKPGKGSPVATETESCGKGQVSKQPFQCADGEGTGEGHWEFQGAQGVSARWPLETEYDVWSPWSMGSQGERVLRSS